MAPTDPRMHPQLQSIQQELDAAVARLRRLAEDSSEEEWQRRPSPGAWSAAECVAHLNLTSEAMLPPLDGALARAREIGGATPARLRRDFFGWLVWRAVKPETKLKAKTTPSFVPMETHRKDRSIEEFERLQSEIAARIRAADGLPIHRVKMASPIDQRVKYSVFAALTVVAAHQHRHLDQAQRALGRTFP